MAGTHRHVRLPWYQHLAPEDAAHHHRRRAARKISRTRPWHRPTRLLDSSRGALGSIVSSDEGRARPAGETSKDQRRPQDHDLAGAHCVVEPHQLDHINLVAPCDCLYACRGFGGDHIAHSQDYWPGAAKRTTVIPSRHEHSGLQPICHGMSRNRTAAPVPVGVHLLPTACRRLKHAEPAAAPH